MCVIQGWASGCHIATCGDGSKISAMHIFKIDHSEHQKEAICGDIQFSVIYVVYIKVTLPLTQMRLLAHISFVVCLVMIGLNL